MIAGSVNPNRQPIIEIAIRGTSGREETISFLLDSGFNGSLVLPAEDVTRLGLAPLNEVSNILIADGSRLRVPIYTAAIVFDGKARVARVLASGTQPLLGMALALGYNISIDVVDGGRVILTPLPPPDAF